MNSTKNDLIELIGNTPIVKIDFEDVSAKIFAKLEYLNPTGSVKDRSALYMIETAEKNGELKSGGTVIEASSGNQGIAMAAIANAKGYNAIITVPEKISKEKRMTMEAYGAKVIVCKSSTHPTDSDGYYAIAKKINSETPNSFMLNQYYTERNAEAHFHYTGREIWHQIGNFVTHCILGVGSGGTICGVSKFLKEKNPNIKIIGVDSINSYGATKGNPKPYHLDGMGIDHDIPFIKKYTIDEMLYVSDEEAHSMLKTLAKKQGFLVGPASGGVAAAAYKYSKNLTSKDIILILFTDSGRAYLSKEFYS
jgi:cystathionine beta-synthase